MSDNYYKDLREFIEVLDHEGLLYRWQRLVDKDSELMPLMRLQYRGRSDVDRQAFLYENVTDGQGRRYGIKVLTGVYAASRKIVGLGMGCKDPGEIYERWRRAVDKPIDPVLVESGPVHEEVHIGAELEKIGLSMLPAPVEEPGFSGDTRVTGPFITEDSASGVRNVGMYSGHFRPPNRLLAGIGPSHHAMLYHYPSAKGRQRVSAGGNCFGSASRHQLCRGGQSTLRVGRAFSGGRDKAKARGDGALQNCSLASSC